LTNLLKIQRVNSHSSCGFVVSYDYNIHERINWRFIYGNYSRNHCGLKHAYYVNTVLLSGRGYFNIISRSLEVRCRALLCIRQRPWFEPRP